jgi:hypothetical protein
MYAAHIICYVFFVITIANQIIIFCSLSPFFGRRVDRFAKREERKKKKIRKNGG